MTKLELEDVLMEIEEAKETLAKDLDEVAPATRGGFEVSKRVAADALPGLTSRYGNLLLEGAVGLFLAGPKAATDKFAEEARVIAGALVVDAGALYERFAAAAEPSMGQSREFAAWQTRKYLVCLEEVTDELGLRLGKWPDIARVPVLREHQDVVDYLRAVTRAAYGDQLLAAYVTAEVARVGVKESCSAPTVPVIVLGTIVAEHAVLSSLFRKGARGITVEKALDKKGVLAELEKVKSKMTRGEDQ